MDEVPDLYISPGKWIGKDHPCFIIAEIGQNHQGDIDIAKELIRVAKDCGTDCVKFQKSHLAEKFTREALAQPYDSVHSWGSTYGEHKEHLEFNEEEILALQKYSRDIGILFTASAMDPISLDFLNSIGVPFVKIGSGDSNNEILLEKAAKTNKPLVISTGMLDMEGVHRIYNTVSKVHKKFALLHCVSSYPTPPDQINLRVLKTYKKEFPSIPIGYSGHELGYSITLAAVALGAKIVERHITLDKDMKGNDHRCSLEPDEFKNMVNGIREIEQALGTGEKQFQKCEQQCKDKLGKSLVAGQNLSTGETLTAEKIKIKVAKPKGLSPSEFSSIIGRVIRRNLSEDESICSTDLIEWEELHD